MIFADRLTKRFPTVTALEEVSFRVASGEVLGFLGPNGAGKTTALRILSGFLPPTSGRASVAGLDLLQHSLEARRRVGYLPENFSAPSELRVGEYLRYRAGLKGMPARDRRGRVGELGALLGLQARMRQPFAALSKGYRQRVGLADALLAAPPVLLLDEPFSGLDPLQRQEFRGILGTLAREEGRAILFSSHVLPEVQGLADRVLILHLGRVRAEGTLEELSRDLLPETLLRVVTEGDPAALEEAWNREEALAHIETADAAFGN
ncbi:MAG: ABC transporter ATP-binding protein, partial [Planctomycetota bacterium]